MSNAIIDLFKNLFFTDVSMTTIAIFRICLGLANLIIISAYIWPNRNLFFGNDGIYPSDNFYTNKSLCSGKYSLLDIKFRNIFNPNLLLILGILCSIFVTFGLYTNVSCLLLFTIYSTITFRNPFIIGGADRINIQLLFWLIFMNSGKCMSVDNILSGGNFLHSFGNPIALRVLQLLLLQIYFLSVKFKSRESCWFDGSVIPRCSRLNGHSKKNIPDIILENKNICKILSIGTLVFELSMIPGLIFLPYIFVPLGMIFHTGLATILNLPCFALIMCAYLTIFIPPSLLDSLLATWI